MPMIHIYEKTCRAGWEAACGTGVSDSDMTSPEVSSRFCEFVSMVCMPSGVTLGRALLRMTDPCESPESGEPSEPLELGGDFVVLK